MWAPEGRDQCWPNTWAGANLDEMKVWGPVTGGELLWSGKAKFC